MSEQTNSICEVSRFSKDGEETLERFDGAFLAHPEQARQSLVDLVNQGQILVPFGVLNFIYPDGANRLQLAMLQTKLDHVFDCVANLFPGGVERLSSFFPRKLPRPTCQEQHVGFGQLVFATGEHVGVFADWGCLAIAQVAYLLDH